MSNPPRVPSPFRPGADAGVLLVASAEVERDALAARIRKTGERVIAVVDGAHAVRALTDAPVPVAEIVVSEPLPDGRTEPLIRYARSISPFAGLRIIVLAEDSRAAHHTALYDSGADLVAAKPIDLDLLSRQIVALRRRAA
jgi:DNA-binding response OmpR family regulator